MGMDLVERLGVAKTIFVNSVKVLKAKLIFDRS